MADTMNYSPFAHISLGGNMSGNPLDTSEPDADRSRMQLILQQLQQQAKTGEGAWRNQLNAATQAAENQSASLAQSSPGLDRLAALRAMGNAQAGEQQRARGQANILQNQAKQNANQQLANIYGQTGALDAQQAATQAANAQATNEANLAQIQNTTQSILGTAGGAGQGAASIVAALSKGGKVPGRPKTFGDDEKNDTVPAMLSPGEIVIPRSITHSPDAPERAAAFVHAVKNRPSHKHHFNGGGTLPDGSPLPDNLSPASGQNPGWYTDAGTGLNVSQTPGGGNTVDLSSLNILQGLGIPGYTKQKASIGNGGLLNTSPYEQSRQGALAAQAGLLAEAQGADSIAPQALQNANDEGMAAALNGASKGGPNIAAAAQQATQAGGRAADTVANETQKAGSEFAHSVNQQRAADLAFAQAQQQAAWRNTLMNNGIGLAQQQMLKGLLSGTGQALATGASAMGGKDSGGGYDANAGDLPTGEVGKLGNNTSDFEDTASSPSDWSTPSGGFAHGGEIPAHEAKRAAAFVRALKGRAL